MEKKSLQTLKENENEEEQQGGKVPYHTFLLSLNVSNGCSSGAVAK